MPAEPASRHAPEGPLGQAQSPRGRLNDPQGGRAPTQPLAELPRAAEPLGSLFLSVFGCNMEPHKLRALDLFSGTGSVARRLSELGFEVLTLDQDPKCHAEIQQNVLKWNFHKLPRHHFDLIAASVPCNEYSCAKTRGQRKIEEADEIVKKVLQIIRYFEPRLWWIENPQSSLLRTRPFMKKIPFVDVDYCQYSDWGYRKPTRIWGSMEVVGRGGKKCDGKTCPNMVLRENGRMGHKQQLGGYGSQPNTRQKGRVPSALVDHLLGVSEKIPSQLGTRLSAATIVAKQGQSSENTPKEIMLEKNILHTPQEYRKNKVTQQGDKLQLLLKISAELPDGSHRVLDVLVDTGAEANLTRVGLFPNHLTRAAEIPLKFVTANGQGLVGGQTCVDLVLEFTQVVDGRVLPDPCRRKASFYEADIRVDAILSFPWMLHNKIGVFPHRHAMALEGSQLTWLYGATVGKLLKKQQQGRNLTRGQCAVVARILPEFGRESGMQDKTLENNKLCAKGEEVDKLRKLDLKLPELSGHPSRQIFWVKKNLE